MLMDRRTDGRTDDGQKVITIAHPEHSSGELKTVEVIVEGGVMHVMALQGTYGFIQFPKLDRNSEIFSKHGGDRHGGRSTACHDSLEKVRIAYNSQNLIKTKNSQKHS